MLASGGWIRRVPGGLRAAVALFVVEHRGVLSVIDTGSPGVADRIVMGHGAAVSGERLRALADRD